MSAWNIRVIFEPDVSLHFFYQANIDKDDDDDYDDSCFCIVRAIEREDEGDDDPRVFSSSRSSLLFAGRDGAKAQLRSAKRDDERDDDDALGGALSIYLSSSERKCAQLKNPFVCELWWTEVRNCVSV